MRFSFDHTVSEPRERLFAFFENPERLEGLHAGWSTVRLLHGEPQVRVGAETWIEITTAGFIPMVVGFRHTLFEPPTRFGEEAIHGPFSKFTHVHEFLAGNGNTTVRDVLELCLPWYYGGESAIRHGVAPVIRRMFHCRAEALTSLAQNGTLTSCASSRNQSAKEI
jgi:ligand-binding SRPBCC domain-containing protein